jgi:hypothetical protein
LLSLACTANIEGTGARPEATGAAPSTTVGGAGGGAGQSGSSGSGGSVAQTGGTGTGGSLATGGAGGSFSTGGTGAGGTGGGVTSSGIPLDGTPVHYRFVRLTHDQWEASVRDLLELTELPGLSSGFVPDPPDGTFTNNERALYVTSDLRIDYQRSAETLAAQVAGDPQALSRVTDGGSDPAAFIRTFGRRVFRRPLTPEEETRYQAVFASGETLVASGNAFNDGVRMVIEGMLQSPNFLYRTELGAASTPVGGYEMASKLSFLLRNTTPDDALLDSAAAGELDTAQGVLAKATAMLDQATGQAVLGRYHAELFGLGRYNQIDKNRTRFPDYSPELNTELEHADRMFFDRIFSSGQGIREILTSPLAFVTSASAPFYDLTANGTNLTEVQLGPERPGFLTRLGFLAFNANLSEPDPIHRGVDIVNRLMCADMMPPPDEIPPLPALMPGQTNRQRVDAFTGPGTCGAGCHSTVINPVGFAFENFDAMGQLRTTDNGQPVDTSGQIELPDGLHAFAGAPELAALLAEAPSVHGCYAMHLAEYTLARDVSGGDRALVDGLEGLSMNDNAAIKAMVLAIVGDPLFLTRTGGVQ